MGNKNQDYNINVTIIESCFRVDSWVYDDGFKN